MKKLDIPFMIFAFIGLISFFFYPFYMHQVFGTIYCCYFYYRIFESKDPICQEYNMRVKQDGTL